jgi:hypothetical protein
MPTYTYKTFVHTKLTGVFGSLRVKLGVSYEMNMDTCHPPVLLPETETIEKIKQKWIDRGAVKAFGETKFEKTFSGWELKTIKVSYDEQEVD